MRKERTIRKELKKLGHGLEICTQGSLRNGELYGAQQALLWVLNEPDTMPPYKSAMLTED